MPASRGPHTRHPAAPPADEAGPAGTAEMEGQGRSRIIDETIEPSAAAHSGYAQRRPTDSPPDAWQADAARAGHPARFGRPPSREPAGAPLNPATAGDAARAVRAATEADAACGRPAAWSDRAEHGGAACAFASGLSGPRRS